MKDKSSFWKRLSQVFTFQDLKIEKGSIYDQQESMEEKKIPAQMTLKKPVRASKTPLVLADQKKQDSSLDPQKLRVSSCLEKNKGYLQQLYVLPKNKDIIVREFYLDLDPPTPALLVFIDGLAEKETINNAILKPLMVFLRGKKLENDDLITYIQEHLLPGHEVEVAEDYQTILEGINYGDTAVFVEGCAKALIVETKGWEKRAIDKPEIEEVILGPHEAFNETIRSNTALIRKNLRNEKLITEMIKVGARNRIDVAVMYLDDLTNPQLVELVKKRISSLNADYISVSSVLEQFIEDNPFCLCPQLLSTERPDRVVSFLMEGHVAVLVDGAPLSLIAPVTFFSLIHSPEDYYLRLPYGNFIRFLRILAILITLLIPGIYVALVTFHQEMIPTELLLAIADSRVPVPFPTIFEVFSMEFAFELIREAGVRIPGIIGNTIGIVGALILGQAAVEAGIVSPILIIVVAIAGLASFAVPNFSLSFSLRQRRFMFTILAAIFGFFGIAGGLFVYLTNLVNTKSFGVPYLAPYSPQVKTSPDVFWRGPLWSMEKRPPYLKSQDQQRQPNISRGWLKKVRRGKKDE